MSKEELNKSLEVLRSEIKLLDVDNKEAKNRIDQLIVDLEHQLENPEDIEHSTTLMETLPKLVGQFEVEHPRITVILEELIATLSNMGI